MSRSTCGTEPKPPRRHPAAGAFCRLSVAILVGQNDESGVTIVPIQLQTLRASPEQASLGPHLALLGDDARAATHLSMSAWIKSANSFGDPPTGSVPCCFSAVRTASLFSAAFAAADSFSMTAGGVAAGARSPIQIPAS